MWEDILKRSAYPKVSRADIRLVNYILRDGQFRTVEAIMDEIYDLIAENKKLGQNKTSKIRGRPQHTKFAQGRKAIQTFMRMSPDYEVRETGNKKLIGTPIKEYRYIGV